ncbi:FAD/NAD(P)-binding domain-containing protein [Mycena haematopus]|nr:FAD/NAD(P)-binding domain-containing protein [Mycena haematopus]
MTHPQDSPRPLNVAIVGAGIGGLAAAVSLRRNGHHIRIFESSQIKTEVGAGIGLQRNAVRILERFGCSRENLKPVAFDGIVVFDAKTGDSTSLQWLIPRTDGTPDLSCHRSDLHDELKRLAIGEGEGPPSQLFLDSKVVACDPEAGTVTLRSGEIYQADVVIGADGVHSAVRASILDRDNTRVPGSGLSCFRCLFDASGLDEIPELAWLSEGIIGARSVAWREDGPLRMFFIYKCRSGTLVNFVGFHTDPKQGDPDWTPATTREEVLQTFHSFHPKFLRIFDLPAASPLMKWQLRVTPILPTWIRGRTALLGDAAHATLPLLGQGLAMGVEDAAALGCLFPLGTTKEDVPTRLEAYQALRKERADYVNTESVAQARPEKRGTYIRSREMQSVVYEHDAVKTAQEYYAAHLGEAAV